MKVLLYGLNYAPEMTGIGKYTGQLGAWLNGRNHDVKAITSPPYYPEWRVASGYKNCYAKEVIDGVEVLRCPLYVPKKGSTFLRLIHLLSFVVTSAVCLCSLLRWRPDVVVNIVPAIFTSFPALIYCKVTGAKLVIHIQDFESDAMTALGMAKNNTLIRIWLKFERFLLSKATKVSSISKAMMGNAISKGVASSNIIFFPNWSEVERFENVSGVDQFQLDMGYSNDRKIVLYSGNIGQKQGLEVVLEAAKLAEQERLNFTFIICGDGAAKENLLDLSRAMNLTNITFIPLQSYEKLPTLLAMADAHLVIQNPNVANAVLPSKLTNILAVGGNAVITTEKDTEMGRLLNEYSGIAISVEPQNAEELLIGIKSACQKEKINSIALSYAKKFLSKESILKEFEQQLISLINNKNIRS